MTGKLIEQQESLYQDQQMQTLQSWASELLPTQYSSLFCFSCINLGEVTAHLGELTSMLVSLPSSTSQSVFLLFIKTFPDPIRLA